MCKKERKEREARLTIEEELKHDFEEEESGR